MREVRPNGAALASERLMLALEDKAKWLVDHPDVEPTVSVAAQLMGLAPVEFAWQLEVWTQVEVVDTYARWATGQ